MSDPQRDVWPVLDDCQDRKIVIRYVLETHVHNDYVTGALEVRARAGAEIVGPVRAGYRFAHRPVRDGDELKVGDVTIPALETPGHTPEHTCYLVLGEHGASRRRAEGSCATQNDRSAMNNLRRTRAPRPVGQTGR